ncbi:MAG: aspartate aminotransferase family protein [Actinobacteria bacterium]|jgi:glutamate-1-semialdehyde 2,1-aminomutase|nr:aspartate aminotransferase family protein [Actinomycetota bacterium]
MPDRPHAESQRLHAQATDLTPGGVHSNVRLAGPPIFFERGAGAWLYDVDGNDYVDYLLGQGPNFLGHAAEEVNEAVASACRRGMVFGAQQPLENEAGRLFLDALGWPEMVRFGLSGTEMVQAALRLARAVTGRDRFVRFEGHYHGWLDNVLLDTDAAGVSSPASQGQLPRHLDDSIVLPWNDPEAVAAVLADRGDEVAAVIMEPFMCNTGAIEPRPGYLERVRELCDRHGVVLIFDEVITGFRLSAGGAAQRFGVTPDLATYGKAMAGGWPVAALAGSRDLLGHFATGVVHAGTFNASSMGCAAVAATLTALRTDPPYTRVEAHGEAVMEGIRGLAKSHDLPLRVQGLGMAFHVSFGDDTPVHDLRDLQRLDLARYRALAEQLVEHGVWVTGRGIWYVSAAHTDIELDAVMERFDATLSAFAA